MLIYKINNIHSFVDVITNSSTEMFISTDKKVIEFFKSMFTEDELNDLKSDSIKLMKFKDYYDDYNLKDEKEDYPKEYEKKYSNLTEEDYILVIDLDYGVAEGAILKIMEKLKFVPVWD